MGQPSVLVCDDDVDIRAAITRVVTARNFAVIEVACGRDAVALLARESIACAFIDIGLPDMDGYEVARRVRTEVDTAGMHIATQPRRPRLVAITSRRSSRDLLLSRDAGFDHHLTMPLDNEKIVAVLATLCLSDNRN